jgi:hypothetical protein
MTIKTRDWAICVCNFVTTNQPPNHTPLGCLSCIHRLVHNLASSSNSQEQQQQQPQQQRIQPPFDRLAVHIRTALRPLYQEISTITAPTCTVSCAFHNSKQRVENLATIMLCLRSNLVRCRARCFSTTAASAASTPTSPSPEAPSTHTMKDIVSLCKRRGFVFPGSEMYGGFANSFDYGPMGVLLKNNIRVSTCCPLCLSARNLNGQ